jgi:hypothetical protein
MLYSVTYRRPTGVRASYWLSTTRKVVEEVKRIIQPKEQPREVHLRKVA